MLALIDTCHATPQARGRLCACLPPPDLGRLRRVAGDLRLDSGTMVFVEGEPAESLFGVRQGTVMLTKRLGDGRRQVLSFLYPGDTFGFADDRAACSAVTLGRTSLCRIPFPALRDDPALAAQMRRIAGRTLAAALNHMLLLGRMTARERVAAFLTETWTRTGRPDELHLPMKVADIGDYLGLRPETVSRMFSEFRRAGWIGPLLPDGTLAVLDPPAVARQTGQGAT